MYRALFKTTVLVLALVAMATLATAQQSQVVHYQGLLTGPERNPLRNGTYSVNFSIWEDSTGGYVSLWSETQIVETTNGLFNVFLGSSHALSSDVFTPVSEESTDLRYLEIQVAGDMPMTPRTQIAKTPISFISSRVLGDIVTGAGLLKLIDPVDKRDAFEALTDTTGNSIKLMDPGDDGKSMIEMNGGVDGRASFKMFNPQPEPPAAGPLIELKTLPNFASFFALNNLTGVEAGPLIEMTTDPTASSRIKIHAAQPTFSGRVEIQAQFTDGANMTLFREGLTPHNEIKAMDLRVGSDIGGEFNIFNYASNVEQELLSISGSPSSGASFKMFNPQPEPPAQLLLEMNTTQYGANIAMAAPQTGYSTDITDPMFEVIADSNGGAINLYDEIGKVMGFEPTPFTPGGRFQMYDPVADAVKFEVETTEDGASISIYDEIGKVMGLDPSPFTPGGFLYFIDPAADDTNMFLGSDGYLFAQKGTFGDNTNTGTNSLTVGNGNIALGDNCLAGGRVAYANHDNCFVWSDYPVGPSVLPLETTASNQFIVRATGGAKFYTNATLTSGVELTPGASSWSSIVALNTVSNVREVDGEDILNKIEQLPIKRYSYNMENQSIEHISPMAEDFNKLFNTGSDEKHLSTLDPSGVALAGVKALLDRIEQLEARITELEAGR